MQVVISSPRPLLLTTIIVVGTHTRNKDCNLYNLQKKKMQNTVRIE